MDLYQFEIDECDRVDETPADWEDITTSTVPSSIIEESKDETADIQPRSLEVCLGKQSSILATLESRLPDGQPSIKQNLDQGRSPVSAMMLRYIDHLETSAHFERVPAGDLCTLHGEHIAKPSSAYAIKQQCFTDRIAKHPKLVIETVLTRILDELSCDVKPTLEQIAQADFTLTAIDDLQFSQIRFNHIDNRQSCDSGLLQRLISTLTHTLTFATDAPELIARMNQLYLHPDQSLLFSLLPKLRAFEPNSMQVQVITLLQHPLSRSVVKMCNFPGSGKTTTVIALADLYRRRILALPRKLKKKAPPTNQPHHKPFRPMSKRYNRKQHTARKEEVEFNDAAPLLVFTCPIGSVLDEMTVAMASINVPTSVVALERTPHNRPLSVTLVSGVPLSQAHVVIIPTDALLALTYGKGKIRISEDLITFTQTPRPMTLFFDEAVSGRDHNELIITQEVLVAREWDHIIIASATLPESIDQVIPPVYQMHEITDTIPEIECESVCMPMCRSRDELVKFQQCLDRSIFARYFTRNAVMKLRHALTKHNIKTDSFPVRGINIRPHGVIQEWHRCVERLLEATSTDVNADTVISSIFEAIQVDPITHATLDNIGTDGFYLHTQVVYGVTDAMAAAHQVGLSLGSVDEQTKLLFRLEADFMSTQKKCINAAKANNRKIEHVTGHSKLESAREVCLLKEAVALNLRVELEGTWIVGHPDHYAKHVEEINVVSRKVDIFTLLQELEPFKVSSTVKFLFICGIGVHSTDLSNAFRHYVRGAFERKVIKVLLTDRSLAFGANIPVSEVILDDTCFQFGPSAILQLAARAGRRGLTDTAKLHVGPRIHHMLVSLFRGGTGYEQD